MVTYKKFHSQAFACHLFGGAMMIRRYTNSLVLLGIGVFPLLNCGSNPVSSVEEIAVSQSTQIPE